MGPHIVCDFLGRTGNIFFQIAACIGYAKMHGANWFIPPNYHHRQIYKHWKLPIYKLNPRKLKLYDVATDEGWGYEPIPFHDGGLRIRGFFQSYLHFDNAEAEVKQAFKLDIKPLDYVSIHVRRGDYLQHNNDFPPVTMEYIIMAMNFMMQRGQYRFLVFSDDLDWCRQNIKHGFAEKIDFVQGNEFTDLSMMASCKHHIIANSTFSWWSAYLGHNPDKIVVSPSHLPGNWFGHNRVDTKDLLPPTWHQIKFR